MKKRTKIIVCIIATILCIGGTGLVSSADFGIGVQVMAEDAKLIKTGLLGKRMIFSELDFKSAMNITDFDSITITEIPSSTDGTLTYGGRRVIAGRVIKRKNIGLLSFIPASDSTTEARFTFTVEPSSSGAKVECIMKFVDKVNYAPKTDDVSVDKIIYKSDFFHDFSFLIGNACACVAKNAFYLDKGASEVYNEIDLSLLQIKA